MNVNLHMKSQFNVPAQFSLLFVCWINLRNFRFNWNIVCIQTGCLSSRIELDFHSTLFRNDNHNLNARPYGGTAIYSQHSFVSSFPLKCNNNGIEITVVRLSTLLNVTVIAIYRSPKISVRILCSSVIEILQNMSSEFKVIIGDFNVNWMNEVQRRPLYNLFVQQNYKQLISQYTTDNRTIIDHIYTNIPDLYVNSGILGNILLTTRPFGCPFHFKLIDVHCLSIKNLFNVSGTISICT